jgi:cell division septation protein DedD
MYFEYTTNLAELQAMNLELLRYSRCPKERTTKRRHYSVSFKKSFLLSLLFFSAAVFTLFAEGELSIDAEIARLQKVLSAGQNSAKEKRDTLFRLGKLYRLSGDIEKAALTLRESAFSENGHCDGKVLLDSILCNIALGELDKANADIALVLSGVNVPPLQKEQAEFLAALVKALTLSDSSGAEELNALAETLAQQSSASANSASYISALKTLYYTLWKSSDTDKDKYRDLLVKLFPKSPEALSLSDDKTGAKVSAALKTHWLLFSGRENQTLVPVSAGQLNLREELAAQAPSAQVPSSQAPSAQATPAQVSATTPVAGTTLLQAGLFASERNALSLAEKIRKSGFEALVKEKRTGDKTLHVVYVVPEKNINESIRKLNAAGYECFPAKLQ